MDSLTLQTLGWLNQNMGRDYPLINTTNTACPVPPTFITDIQLILPFVQGTDLTKFFVSGVQVYSDTVQVLISYQNGAESFVCAVSAGISKSLTAELDEDGQTTALDLHTFSLSPATDTIPDDFAAWRSLSGTVYIGSSAEVQNGLTAACSVDNAGIFQRCVYMGIAGQAQLTVVNVVDEDGVTHHFTDDFTLAGSDSLNITVSGSVVRFSINATWVTEHVVDPIIGNIATAIKTINGFAPDDSGNIQIVGDDCTTINNADDDPNASGIVIRNPCSKPCCDSEDANMADIKTALQSLDDAKNRLLNFYESISTNVNAMQARLSSLIAYGKG